MKTQQQIENEIALLKENLKTEMELFTSLKSPAGQGLAKNILVKTEGKITALKWILE